jgi:hypothetical protein
MKGKNEDRVLITREAVCYNFFTVAETKYRL